MKQVIEALERALEIVPYSTIDDFLNIVVELTDYQNLHSAARAVVDALRAQQEPKCARCGALLLAHGQCSRHSEGCQGGWGEAQQESSREEQAVWRVIRLMQSRADALGQLGTEAENRGREEVKFRNYGAATALHNLANEIGSTMINPLTFPPAPRAEPQHIALVLASEQLIKVLEDEDCAGYIYDEREAECVVCTNKAPTIGEIIHDDGCFQAALDKIRAALERCKGGE